MSTLPDMRSRSLHDAAMPGLISRCAAAAELAVKKAVFDCRACGQCILRQTGLICPLRCPKGLRNGPCGGTTNGRCEVHPDQACIWVRIDQRRTAPGDLAPSPLFDAPDPALFGSASVLNAISGADRPARTPLPWLDLPSPAAAPRTVSAFEAALRRGDFVVTGEVRAPRDADLTRTMAEAQTLQAAGFTAINATSFLRGRPALPSGTVAAALQEAGIEAIAQTTGRDHTRTTFVGELLAQQRTGVRNLLCLTGDAWHGGAPRAVFEMDAGLMLYEARWLAERGQVRFSGERLKRPPRPFLGAALNPAIAPLDTAVRRFRQKIRAGCEFVQTQALTTTAVLDRFLARWRAAAPNETCAILAGIPVVTERAALEHLPRIPGIAADPAFLARLRGAPDLRRAGIAAAIELALGCAALDAVHGVHLMLFGHDHDALAEVRSALPPTRRMLPCPSPDSPLSANASIPASAVPAA